MERHECPLSEEDILQIKEGNYNKQVILNMQEDIQSLKASIKEIHDALIGDSFNPGFKQRIQKVELDTDKNTQRLNKLVAYGTAVVSVLGVLGIVFGILSKTGII